ncbi:MAG: ATP-binding protein [Spirochaetae bacterium HGW-Spirochaetae-8]|jgi:Mrp family chromosome partitioning ATPase|nr:MAG: ATP-binding protein [Spirochaetae bacterium HGW-Spirochaetae-8]
MPELDFEKRVALRDAIRSHMDAIGRKILVMSGKGGVGKTTVAVNLARQIAYRGYRTGILDTDLHGPNVAKMLGVAPSELQRIAGGLVHPVVVQQNLAIAGVDNAMANPEDAVIWRGPMKTIAINDLLAKVQWGPLDFLFIDSPPGSGDEQITVCKSIPELTGAIIVTTPQEVSLLDARRSVAFCRKMGIAILGVVENMSALVCPCCHTEIPVFGIGGGEMMAQTTGTPFLGRIPLSVPRSSEEGLDRAAEDAFARIAMALAAGMTCSGIKTEENRG